MRTCTLSLAAGLSLVAGAAAAEGLPERMPAAPCCEAPRSWTGFYLGVGLGAGTVDGFGGEGSLGTAIVGYDHQFGRWVAGIFADYDFSNLGSDVTLGGGSGQLDQDRAWSVGARLGFLASPSTLWYGTAGYTSSKFDLSTSTGSFSVPDFTGYFVGGGMEAQLADGFALRAEYRFSQFDSENVVGPGFDVDLEPSVHTARIVLTYKFGRHEPAGPMK